MLSFEILVPERIVISGQAKLVVLPGEEGDLGILEKHAPIMTLLRPGVVHIYSETDNTSLPSSQQFFVSGGFANINNNICSILADEAHFVEPSTEKTL